MAPISSSMVSSFAESSCPLVRLPSEIAVLVLALHVAQILLDERSVGVTGATEVVPHLRIKVKES